MKTTRRHKKPCVGGENEKEKKKIIRWIEAVHCLDTFLEKKTRRNTIYHSNGAEGGEKEKLKVQTPHRSSADAGTEKKKEEKKVYKMTLSLSCLVILNETQIRTRGNREISS